MSVGDGLFAPEVPAPPGQVEECPTMLRWFISHASKDRHVVEGDLLELFKALGQTVWYPRESIRTTEEWERSIKVGLDSSDWFVLVMSPQSANSEWVKRELGWALRNRP